MELDLTRYWWTLVLRGVAAAAFGVLTLIWPGLTLLALVILFGAYAITDGVLDMVLAVAGRRQFDRWWVLLLKGSLGVSVGVMTFVWPGITGLALLFAIAFWATATGALEIIAAIRLRKYIRGEWLLGLSGTLSVLFGLALVVWPAAGAVAIAWLIGSYAIVFGALLIVLGVRLRELRGRDARRNAPAHVSGARMT